MGEHVPRVPHTKLRPCNQSWLWSRLQTTLAQIARIGPKWMYIVLNIFSTFTIFEQLALALKKQSCLEIFRCMEYNLYIHNFGAACRCPEKQSCPDIFHCIEQVLFIIQKFWVTCACSEKHRVPWNFSLYGIYFLHSGVIGQLACACPEKQRVPWSLYWTCIFYQSAFFSN